MIHKHRSFLKELESLINKYSLENKSDTPDYILAEYINDCLKAFDKATNRREIHYGRTSLSEMTDAIRNALNK